MYYIIIILYLYICCKKNNNNLIILSNLGYQMEIARIKIIEEENSRINQTIDKSNYGNV